jgi:hypothetical protein
MEGDIDGEEDGDGEGDGDRELKFEVVLAASGASDQGM